MRGPDELDCSFGAVPRRRREAAVCIQQVMRERLAKKKIPSVLKLFDVKNAFCSVSHEVVDKGIEDLRSVRNDRVHQSSSQAIIKNRVRNHKCTLQASDGPLLCQPGEGAPQGHSLATKIFGNSYSKPIDKYDKEVIRATGGILIADNPIDGKPAHVSNTLFVDDSASTC